MAVLISPMCIYRKARAFTLIELLVVISIIALLISILLPTLVEVRKMAKFVQCATTQRALGIAQRVYSMDYDGWGLMGHNVNGGSGSYQSVYQFTAQSGGLAQGLADRNVPWQNFASDYMGTVERNVFHCPEAMLYGDNGAYHGNKSHLTLPYFRMGYQFFGPVWNDELPTGGGGYIYLSSANQDRVDKGQPAFSNWFSVYRLSRANADHVMMADTSKRGEPGPDRSGWWFWHDPSSHDPYQPRRANVLFADGSVNSGGDNVDPESSWTPSNPLDPDAVWMQTGAGRVVIPNLSRIHRNKP